MLNGEVKLDLKARHTASLLSFIGIELQRISNMAIGIMDSFEMVTANGCSDRAQVEDVVCLFNGISVPCILRRKGSHHTLIAVCQNSSIQSDGTDAKSWEGYEQRRSSLV
jgi:hypothetical protein